MLPNSWFETNLKPHAQQSALWRCKARFVAVVAGRGSGKTMLARMRIVRMLPLKKPWSDPLYFYALPTVQMAKRIAWPKIKELIPREWVKDKNETEMRIDTVFGSTLYLFGMDKPARAEGSQYDFGVIDESSDHKPGVFNKTFLPALSHKKGVCWRIGVPKRYGPGAKDFKTFYEKGLRGECINNNPEMRIQSFTWQSKDLVDPDVLAFARANLEARDFNEQYDAKWEEVGGKIYYAYDDILNTDEVVYRQELPIVVGSDFNVNPMSWVIGHRFKNRIDIFDEIYLRNVSTQDALNELYRRYSSHRRGFEFFGDATGRARKTAASSAAFSDYIQIKNDSRFRGSKIFYPKSNPYLTDRYASVNAMLCNANRERRLFVNPRCVNLRKDLDARVYIEGTREPDNSNPDAGHITDALGYIVHRAFPLTIITESSPQAHIEVEA